MRATWLFSRDLDLAVFGGSAALSFAALGLGAAAGVLHADTPSWAWVPAVLLCDVAHVWATLFRTYLDPVERRARPRLLAGAPAVALACGVALFAAAGPATFWRALAYVAIFHFVRQQYGWVALYRARAGERGRLGKVVDTAAIYAATLWPLLYWNTHLPRSFAWFVDGDIVALPGAVMPAATALYVAALAAYALRAASLWARGRANPGKDLVVATTAAAWYVGIVAFDSDYAFTVTNVIMHGVPYFALVWVHARARASASRQVAQSLGARLTRSVFVYVAVLWTLAFVETLAWDRTVWHERTWLFGAGWDLPALQLLIVPLLAVPQLTHYLLDGFIWRRRSNPSIERLVAGAPAEPARVAL